MTLTLLLDLDDTLLDLNTDIFATAYFKKLAGFLANRVNPGRLIDELIAGTNAMLKNERPDLTLEEVFNQCFYPAIGIEQAELQPEIERFYNEVFSSLKEFATPRPEAARLVEYALEKEWRVVVAANPLFPRKAMEQCLRWANLPPEKYNFTLVTSMETSHFTKGVSAYYLEIMGNLGWPDGPVIMVGDDPVIDIDSALRAGLPTFWIRPDQNPLPDLMDLPQGTIKDFHTWIDSINFDLLQPSLKNPEALLYSLQSTPAALDSFIRTLGPDEWTARPREDEWALVEILCHLRDLDVDVNLPRALTLMTEDNAFIAGQDTDPWAKERQYIKQDGLAAFRDFVTARMKLVGILKSLSREGWDRRARHTIFGPTRLQELVSFIAEHDRTHIQHVIALLRAVRGTR
jgi:FMN phosphatase YigB (HAD superfamily)